MAQSNSNFKQTFTFLNDQDRPDVELFDPPMCCPTGMCGPSIDQTLLDLGEAISALQKDGFRVERYQMASHPQAFVSNPDVMRLMREKQMAALPVVVVRGKIVAEGRYPTLAEFQNILIEGK